LASTIEKIKQLREETAAGMMDVKRALEESDGDVEGARQVLRERGQALAAKKSGSGFPDLSGREIAVLTPLIVLIIVLGFFPGPLLDVIEPSVAATMTEVGLGDPVGGLR